MGWVAFNSSVVVQASNPEREEVNSSTEASGRAFTSQVRETNGGGGWREREGRSIRALGSDQENRENALEGKPIPTELRNNEAELCREINLEDENCQYVSLLYVVFVHILSLIHLLQLIITKESFLAAQEDEEITGSSFLFDVVGATIVEKHDLDSSPFATVASNICMEDAPGTAVTKMECGHN
ncbi:hypothetical protein RHMOL_Rhmol04G0148200 [Rhododendron molle]|uniref:Uncharacterized protein n=1 Tax=Rhododendron molle TaxID=49168 RepID=A0ACC0P2A9_RHOML|nr:hypothetical protein RHMOL_Rhmol04G0148200 [Rhododendron molle]